MSTQNRVLFAPCIREVVVVVVVVAVLVVAVVVVVVFCVPSSHAMLVDL